MPDRTDDNPRRRALAAAVVCLLIGLSSSPAFAQEESGAAPPPEHVSEGAQVDRGTSAVPAAFGDIFESDEPVVLSADRIDYDSASDTYRASGHVRATQGDNVIEADRVLIDMVEQTASAEGNVVIGNADGELRAPAVHLNFRTRRGVIVDGSVVVHAGDSVYRFRGRRVEKIGEDRYFIAEGWYTTCDCDEDEADWHVEADEIDVTLDGYALVRRARLYMGGAPVAYIPFGVLPAKITRQTGFLSPEFGWSSDDGWHLGIPFFWAIDEHVDATLYSDYYEKRGLKEGVEYRYALAPQTRGVFDLDYIDDFKFGDRRWALGFEHYQNVWRRLYLRAGVNTVSDNQYVVDFPRDINARYDRFLRSDVILNNLEKNTSANLDFRTFDSLDEEDNSYTWQVLPEVLYDVMPMQIGSLPLALRARVAAASFHREKVSPDERAREAELGHERPYYFMTAGRRLEIAPEILAPIQFDRYAFLLPSFTLRETVYELPDRQENEDELPARHLYEVRTDLFTRTERAFPVVGPVVKGWKHQIEPGVRYSYIPPVDQETLPVFDGADRVFPENLVTYYVSNRLWLRYLRPGARMYETAKLLDLRLSHAFDMREAQREDIPEGEERRPLGPVRAELESLYALGRFVNKAVVRSGVDYNLYDDQFTSLRVLGALGTVNDDELAVEYRYAIADPELPPEDPSSVDDARRIASGAASDLVAIDNLTGIARYAFFEWMSLSYLARYSFIDEDFIERIYGVEFHSLQDCWNLIFQIERRTIPERETIYRVSLDLTGLVAAATSF
ncbi:LPS assembly protein LptD [bacterium]|nr:LPS assembly protein LptD [bacterium]